MGDEVHADTFGADETHGSLDFFLQSDGGVFKEQVRFVEEKDEFRQRRVAAFGQDFTEAGEEPDEEGAVNARCAQ